MTNWSIETKNNFSSPEMLERIAATLRIDTVNLFFTEKTAGDYKSLPQNGVKGR